MDRASFHVSDDHVTTPKPVKTLLYVLLIHPNVSLFPLPTFYSNCILLMILPIPST